MIKLLLLLSFFLPLYSQQTLYDFPRQHQVFLHHLQNLFLDSSHIRIITPSLDHPELQKKLISHIKKGNAFTLILQNPHGSPLSLVQYRGIDLRLYSKRPLHGTIIATDTEVCYLSVPINSSVLNRAKSFGWCSDDPQILSENRLFLEKIFNHTTAYLK